jgi:hypothetical protein
VGRHGEITPVRVVVSLTAAVVAAVAHAQQIGVPLDGADGSAVLNALARECYEAGMWSEMPSDSIMDCADPLEEPAALEDSVAAAAVVRDKLRFTWIEGAGRVAVEAWTETEELGTLIEEPVTDEEYLERVQGVLTDVITRARVRGAPPWAGRFESEQAWHLAAHLRAVSHCDANLASMTPAGVATELESIGLRPLNDELRDRCEQLYTHLYEWALARGEAEPSVAAYQRYRAALPPEQRRCSGQLARDATCRQ